MEPKTPLTQKQGFWWTMTVVLAFASLIAGVQIDSAHADKYHINWLYWVLCPLFGILTVYAIYRLIKLYNQPS